MGANPDHVELSIGQQILRLYRRLTSIPGGRFLFNRFIALKIPYSASTGARVSELEAGYAKLTLKDKRSIRNHLNSIHAIALTNLGELASGLALTTGLPGNVRGIVLQICTDYIKKARGTLTAECRCTIPDVTRDMEYIVETLITDHSKEVVAKVRVMWRLGLKPDKSR